MIRNQTAGAVAWRSLTIAICLAWLALSVSVSQIAPRQDMKSYVMGARAAALGESPYTDDNGYYYPPFLAVIASPYVSADDQTIAFAGNLIVAVSSVVLVLSIIAFAGLGGSPWGVVAAATLFLPLFQDGLVFGNMSVVVAALLAMAGLLFRKHPIASGALLATATHLKVVPGLLILFLLFSGIIRKDKAALTATVSASVLGAAALLLPWTGDYLQLVLSGGMQGAKLDCGSNFSWVAFFHSAGISLPSAVPMVLALASVLVLARRGPGSDLTDWAVLHCLMIFASPIVWFHTFAMAVLPVAAIASGVIQGRSILPVKNRPARWLDMLLPVVALSVIMDAEHYYMRTWAGQFITPLLPLLLPLFLAWTAIKLEPKEHNRLIQ